MCRCVLITDASNRAVVAIVNINGKHIKMKKQGLSWGVLLAASWLAMPVWADEVAGPATTPAPASGDDTARQVLQQQTDDASTEKNLEEVFQASEKTYSLLKAGKVGLLFDVDYSYYRDSRIDIAISENSSTLTRFRIEEDAQNTFTNNLELSYGVRDNLTFTASLPFVAKFDTQSDLQVYGLGDIGLGVRWQPIPLKRGLPTTTLFAGLSTASGDSPYKLNLSQDLSTGKGYYSLSAGVSVSKVTDPIVLFGSASFSTNTRISGLDQNRGGRVLTTVEPGDSIGFAMGLAYALNYDVSMTASYQQSYSFSSTYSFKPDDSNPQGAVVNTAPQTSGSLNFSLGLRTDSSRIVNVSLGYGLTEDTPDITLGFSMPIDFLGSSGE